MEEEKQVKKQPLPLPPAAYKDTHTNGNKSPKHQPPASSATKQPRNNNGKEDRERALSNGIRPIYTPKRKCSTLHRESEISLEEYGPEFERLEREKLTAELKKNRHFSKKNQPHLLPTAVTTRGSSKNGDKTQTDRRDSSSKLSEPQTTPPQSPPKFQKKDEATSGQGEVSFSSGSDLLEKAHAGLSVEELALLVISKAQELDISMNKELESGNRITHDQIRDTGDTDGVSVVNPTMTTEQLTSLVNEQAQNITIEPRPSATTGRDGQHTDQDPRNKSQNNDITDHDQHGSHKHSQDSPQHRVAATSLLKPSPIKSPKTRGDSDDEDDFMDDAELSVAVSDSLKSKSMRVSPSRQQSSTNGHSSPRKLPSSPHRVPNTYHGRPNTTSAGRGGASPLCSPRHQPVANLSELGEFERRLLQAKMGKRAPMPDMSKISWYHPGISRHIAECLLLSPDMKDGTYLLRDSVTSNDSLTVSARCQNSVKHYRVEWNGKQFCFGLGKFSNVDALIEHFDNQPMISGESGLMLQLSHPYPRKISEPSVYEHPAIVIQSESSVTLEEGSEKKRWSERPHSWRKKKDVDVPHTVSSSNANVVPPPLSINSKEGFLTKLGQHRKNWKRRWFVLYRNELKYFNSREDKEPLKTINLDDVIAVEMDDTSGKTNCFRLVTSYRTFFIFADTPSEANDWVEILEWKINAMMSSLSFQSQLSTVITEKQS